MYNIIIKDLEVIVTDIQQDNTVMALFKSGITSGVILYEEFLELYGVKKTRPVVILVSGYKNSGKDFISEKILKSFLDSKRFSDSKLFSIANPLKQIIATTFDISLNELDEYKNEQASLYTSANNFDDEVSDFRTILQRFGCEAMKAQFGNDVWVNLFIEKIEPISIVSDWRFISEYEAIAKVADVITIRVEDLTLKSDGHTSEEDLETFIFDFTIDNTAKDSTHISSLNHFLRFFESEYRLEHKGA